MKLNAVQENYKYDIANHLTSVEVKVQKPKQEGILQYNLSYEYDKNGNMIKDHRGEYTYNEFDQMVEAKVQTEEGLQVQRNYYDAEELRYQIEENDYLTQYVYNMDKEAVVEIENNIERRIVRGLGILSSDCEKARIYYICRQMKEGL